MRDASLSRAGSFRALELRRAAGAVAILFARAWSRAQAVHRAMLSRGFDGTLPRLRQPPIYGGRRMVRLRRRPRGCRQSGLPETNSCDAASIVVIRDLHFTYPDGTRALEGVDFELSQGATVALFGPNGSGKTTFAASPERTPAGTGVIEIDGLPLTRANLPGSAETSAWSFRIPITSFSCRR